MDLEKEYNRVARKVLKWALMRREIPKIYINLIQDIYEGSSTSVKNMCGVTEDFNEGVGVHQGIIYSFKRKNKKRVFSAEHAVKCVLMSVL